MVDENCDDFKQLVRLGLNSFLQTLDRMKGIRSECIPLIGKFLKKISCENCKKAIENHEKQCKALVPVKKSGITWGCIKQNLYGVILMAHDVTSQTESTKKGFSKQSHCKSIFYIGLELMHPVQDVKHVEFSPPGGIGKLPLQRALSNIRDRCKKDPKISRKRFDDGVLKIIQNSSSHVYREFFYRLIAKFRTVPLEFKKIEKEIGKMRKRRFSHDLVEVDFLSSPSTTPPMPPMPPIPFECQVEHHRIVKKQSVRPDLSWNSPLPDPLFCDCPLPWKGEEEEEEEEGCFPSPSITVTLDCSPQSSDSLATSSVGSPRTLNSSPTNPSLFSPDLSCQLHETSYVCPSPPSCDYLCTIPSVRQPHCQRISTIHPFGVINHWDPPFYLPSKQSTSTFSNYGM
ncbi:hypothetical protein ADUPG1_013372 [Aduncisulcus paluster]|uniref:Uncharacterized protein n=1 Tax=Aduncisulcus paluster TaxID=2918883 RepID=A0ABQ5K7G6_9EUKA|nr:hypothetical protein ADUPG1_013372 [Aduncisulcus paluster]